METDWYYRLVILFALLVVSAFFSGSEVALFSLEKKKDKQLSDKSITDKYILKLLKAPRRLLITILLGNTLINVAASIVAVSIAVELSEIYSLSLELLLFLQISALTILILLFGEIIPKVWASKFPLLFSRIVALPLYFTHIVIYPISKILTDSVRVLFKRLKPNKASTAISTEELEDLANIGFEKGTIEEDEQELIHGLVSFKSIAAREVMTPRVDLTAISVDTDIDELMKIITESGHSRIPLFENSLDNIVGIIYAKDLLPILKNKNELNQLTLKSIARKAIFFPETKLISELLQEFQQRKMHIGIVVDEYGGTSGIITLEDILEEIVGEIRDEYDKEENEITKINDSTYLVLGKTSMDELAENLPINFPEEHEDFDTIGGFIFSQAGRIPEPGYSFVFEDFTFIVKKVENKRIEKVLIELPKVKE